MIISIYRETTQPRQVRGFAFAPPVQLPAMSNDKDRAGAFYLCESPLKIHSSATAFKSDQALRSPLRFGMTQPIHGPRTRRPQSTIALTVWQPAPAYSIGRQ